MKNDYYFIPTFKLLIIDFNQKAEKFRNDQIQYIDTDV